MNKPSRPPSARPPSIRETLVRGEVILLDGAIGTELEARGVATPLPLWSAQALLDAPDTLRAIHEDYARAGADVHATCTFRTTPRAMRAAGHDAAEAERLTRLAVDVAREGTARGAHGRGVWVAGGMGPLEDCFRPDLAPAVGEATTEHRAQSALLASCGVDLLFIETMNTIAEAAAAVAAAKATGLPVFVSFIARDAASIWSGEGLADAVRAVDVFDPDAILVNCMPAAAAEGCLDTMARATRTPIGCYPNTGEADVAAGTWRLDASMTPERFASFGPSWLGRGALLVGGCCGTGPAHIRALRDAIPPVLVE